MKDYYFSFDKDAEYYLYYEKDKKEIIVYLSNGKAKIFDNTKENEIEILKKMEEQLKKYEDDYIKFYSEDSEEMIKKVSPFVYLSSLFSFSTASPFYMGLNYVVLGLSTIAISKASIEYFIAKSTLKDYEKHKLFMDNKELLDVQLNGDLRLLKGVNKKALREAEENVYNHQRTININTVRLFKYKELESIIEKAKDKEKKDKQYVLRHR